jgi:Polyketide cyclase / dehydrase and lipid transport
MWTTEASAISSATIEAIWNLYSTVETWPQWDHGLESCQLEGSFEAGTQGEMMIKGAPAPFPFKLTEVKALEIFSDETFLPGATVHFVHTLERTPQGTRITHRASITGEHWERFAQTVGADIERGLPTTVQTLARFAERL